MDASEIQAPGEGQGHCGPVDDHWVSSDGEGKKKGG